MENVKAYENYPRAVVLLAVLVNVSIYAAGVFILSGFGNAAALLYLLACLGNELHVMKKSCVDCCYFGKWCAFGKGKVAPLLFKQGDPGRFISKIISWKDLLPDMLVLMIPLVGGVALLIRGFSWSVAMMLVFLLVLSFGGNYLVRSRIACKYCRQREIAVRRSSFSARRYSARCPLSAPGQRRDRGREALRSGCVLSIDTMPTYADHESKRYPCNR